MQCIRIPSLCKGRMIFHCLHRPRFVYPCTPPGVTRCVLSPAPSSLFAGRARGSAHKHPAWGMTRSGGKPPARLPSPGPAPQHTWTRAAVDLRGPHCGVAGWEKCARLGAGRGGLGPLPAPKWKKMGLNPRKEIEYIDWAQLCRSVGY